MTPPHPPAIRLLTRAPGGKAPKPPFGLAAWSPTADAVAIVLDAPDGDPHAIVEVAEQVPLASTLPPGTTVIVFGRARSHGRLWRLLGRTAAISRAARCSALLVRGYVDIGAGVDESTRSDLAWGSAP